jgi:carbamoyl-phosphate synthase large subunit
MSMRFLVTGANGDIAEAIGRILKTSFPQAIVDGADSHGALNASLLFDTVHRLPPARSPDFPDALSSLALKYDRVIPVPEAELVEIAAQGDAWRSALPLVMNAPWVVATFCDKLETARWLQKHGDFSARTMHLRDTVASDLPIVAKPRAGWGSRGVEIVRSPERLAAVRAEATGEWIAQELLDAPDEEHTCAIAKDGAVVNTVTMLRTMQGGLTKQATIVEDAAIEEMLRTIADKLPDRAFINVQLRRFRGRPKIFEINPRFSSTVMMRHLVGFQDLVWILNALGGQPMQPAKARLGAIVIRMSREVVVGG